MPAKREEKFYRKFDIETWKHSNKKYSNKIQKQPFRILVKKLIKNDTSFTDDVIKKILRNFKTIRKIEIYSINIRARNYKNKYFMDFSIS
jgi:hypothetical protein